MISSRKIFISVLSVITSCVLFSLPTYAQKKDDSGGSNKLYGNATIVSNYVDKGLTQSDKSWALQSGFGYQMGPQAHIGIWGSSVKLPSNSENLNLRTYFDVKVDFSQNSNLVLRYDFNRYFQSDAHSGTLLSADFSAFGYHVQLEQNSNWEGTSNPSTWYGFSKDFKWSYGFVFTPQLGYSQLSTDGYSNYFDARAGFGYKFADVLYELAATYNSNASQFKGQGDMAVLLVIKANF